jgi:hypothetical protein
MSVGEFNRKTIEALASCNVTPIAALFISRKLKLVDPVAMPIHPTHEYVARSNNNHDKGMEIFVGNLLLDSGAPNIIPKLFADSPGFRIVTIFSINPIADRTRSEFAAFEI